MARDPAYIRKLKEFTRGPLVYTDLPLLERELYGGNDRATVLMYGAVVEMALTSLIQKRILQDLDSDDKRRLFEYDGPVGTFASKIVLARAIGAIGPKTYEDLDIIRQLRNEFAHSRKHFGFTTPEIAEVCKHLQTPDLPGAFIPHGYLNTVPQEKLAEAADKTHPKTRYMSACHSLAERMLIGTDAIPSLTDVDSGVP